MTKLFFYFFSSWVQNTLLPFNFITLLPFLSSLHFEVAKFMAYAFTAKRP